MQDLENLQKAMEELKLELNQQDKKLRSKISFLLSRIQDIEASMEIKKGDVFEVEQIQEKNIWLFEKSEYTIRYI